MAFTLGNYNIDEIMYGIAENFDGDLLYTLDQLSKANIEISSESNDITDKNGNVVRTIYKSKTGEFTATNAFLHPQIQNAASGSDLTVAATGSAVPMPKVHIIEAGSEAVVLDAPIDDELSVIGIFGSGANSEPLTKASGSTPSSGKYAYDATTHAITVPAAADGEPVKYLVKYERQVESGIKLTNEADKFPPTVRLTLYCSYVDPCDDDLRPCYVVLPSFQASPETTINLDSEEQEMDFNGKLQTDYCAAQKALYYIYFPDEDIVTTATVSNG